MARDNAELDESARDSFETLPHRVTVVGHGVPASFEITVAGEIKPVDTAPAAQTATVSSHAVEGTIETGVTQFRFSSELANAHLVDWNGFEWDDSPSAPTIHVEYGTR